MSDEKSKEVGNLGRGDEAIELAESEPPAEKAADLGDVKYGPIRTDPSHRDKDLERVVTGNVDEDTTMLARTASGKIIHNPGGGKEGDFFRTISRRITSAGSQQAGDHSAEQEEINRLLSRMFGSSRNELADEKTRHVGVIFKHLVVRGMGLGASLQPEVGEIFLGLPRKLRALFRGITSKKRGADVALNHDTPLRTILNDFTGCIRPGEMLLVLGRPGSGCSTFLKVLGNQRFGYESVEGDVTYGGTDAETMAKRFRGEILYNPEDDLHYATLTVQDTLRFGLRTRTPGKESRKEGETRSAYISEFLRVVSKLFWIEHTMRTKVGGNFIRGVSGGEKKRVSIAEAMITKASTQCWDNSTRGLDASTALEYVESLRSLTSMAQISTAVALYQAGESLYQLFDKVILIHDGQCAYFGPADQAAGYFKSLGFIQPGRWTTADFLTSVTDEHERQVQDGYEHKIPRTGADFAAAFAASDIVKHNLSDIAELEKINESAAENRRSVNSKAALSRNYTLPFHKQVMACTARQYKVILGDKLSLFGKWGGLVFLALIVGSLFYDLPKTSAGVFTRGGVLFFMLLFNVLLSLAELTSAFGSRPIMLKHKSFSFYRPAAYAAAQVAVDAPLVLIQVLIWDLIVYFMAGLQRTASQFFISLLVLWCTTMTMYSFFRSVGSVAASLDVATRITGPMLQILIVYTGYLIPPRKMKPWLGWLRWLNPVQYGFEALLSNEFHNFEIECQPPFLVPQAPNASPKYQSCTIQGSQPGSTVVNGADYIHVAYGYSHTHLWRNIGIILAFFLFFAVLTAVGTERQKPNGGGGAVTVYKRGQVPKRVQEEIEGGKKSADDEETGKQSGGVISTANLESDVNHGSSDQKHDVSEAQVAKNEAIFTWQNVNYTIPFEGGERKLLQGVEGFVRPGKLTALMGASGAGKTTLLNTLAQRINFGVISGDFLVDGRPLPKSFQRATGFAEQMDIHEPTATVREAFRFSAKLRQPREVPLAEKYNYCEKIIDLLEMRDIAGATIGEVGAGLNQEQRKRLTIGVELASKPELLLFLDEPTSGLDSGAAFNIIRFLRKLADAGQAILCTIHQPSSVLFEYFDLLLLLKSGGRTVYFGEVGKDSHTLIEYLQRNGAKKCPSKANPAEYMLEAIGAGNPDYKGPDWGDIWDASTEHEKIATEIKYIIDERTNSTHAARAVTDDREYAMPLQTQLSTVIHRAFVSVWRNPEYVIGKTILHIFTGLFNTFTFWNLGNSQIDFQSRLFSCFMTLTISPPLIQQLQPRFLASRSIFEFRERNAKIYSWFAFTWGAVLVEVPYSIVAGTIYWCCWYWGVGFPRDTLTSAAVWLFTMIFEMYYVSFGQAIASFCPNELFASLLVPIFFTFITAFCGAVAPPQTLPAFWHWMYWLSPFHYLFEGFLGLVTHNIPLRCDDKELAYFSPPPNQSCQTYAGQFAQRSGGYVETQADGRCGFCQYRDGDAFSASFSIYYSHTWRNFGLLWVYVIFNFSVVFFCSWLYLQGGRRFTTRLRPVVARIRALIPKKKKT